MFSRHATMLLLVVCLASSATLAVIIPPSQASVALISGHAGCCPIMFQGGHVVTSRLNAT